MWPLPDEAVFEEGVGHFLDRSAANADFQPAIVAVFQAHADACTAIQTVEIIPAAVEWPESVGNAKVECTASGYFHRVQVDESGAFEGGQYGAIVNLLQTCQQVVSLRQKTCWGEEHEKNQVP